MARMMARRPVGDHQQGIAKPAYPHVLEKRPHRLGILLRAGHQMEQNLAAIFANAPGGDHRLTRLAGAQPLGNSIDVEVDDPVLGSRAEFLERHSRRLQDGAAEVHYRHAAVRLGRRGAEITVRSNQGSPAQTRPANFFSRRPYL